LTDTEIIQRIVADVQDSLKCNVPDLEDSSYTSVLANVGDYILALILIECLTQATEVGATPDDATEHFEVIVKLMVTKAVERVEAASASAPTLN